MVYGILGLINFAHGEVVMMGAMVALTVSKLLIAAGAPPLLVLLIALMVAAGACMALGYAIERIAYRPLRNAPRLAPLITAIGVSIVLQNLAMIFWGREYHAFPQLLSSNNDVWTHVIGTSHPSRSCHARSGRKPLSRHIDGS